ncbi:MAG: undecaprenyl-diphosphatase UppP [Clostridiales bacterium]|uniref:undecaprenyl-diphosphatase UppP n=2 Tax=Aminipila sp. TaxID=2060095 RepID=UPI001DDADD39|nr:undecaprenyl-diphosphatase UppP [Aminipila sp.]MBE6033939.1 undecaprenyl-diphosphatase UppP [Clostridiales bacterium]
MTLFEAIILGLVQGLAEFLPISSSGHLALLQYFFGIEGESVLAFAVLLHLGTLISVFIVYWKDIVELVIELFYVIGDIFTGKGLGTKKNDTRRMGYMIIVATIPTAIIGIVFNDLFKSFYTTLMPIGVGLLITGTILFIAERLNTSRKGIREMKFRHAILVGICQGIAITPGISRSGSTLFGGLISGINREVAVKYAFLISIPSILGSVILEAPAAFKAGVDMALIIPILVGVIIAAVSGLVAIKTMINFVSKQKLCYFSYYTWILGVAVIIYSTFIA